ncbi:hypothetical protein M3610_10255 [Neobacillus sp. MER 74]|uniref:hypothetical protein n=1 Tax=Neobacillus sp. MER 74 TaxID=2939566 RepID=UPI002040C35E|nr:hypothetical protein [Neobacillus sp. MER 74]MCM3115670.1 hypothetical protein [Neobacillus sp. MER 74]
MENKFSTPKGFGEILDHTFQLTKNRFKDFFMILLIFMGPVYLVQAILQLSSGTSFFREVGSDGEWFDQILTSFEESGTFDSSSLGADIGLIIIGILSAILAPVAEAAILFTINHVRRNEDYSVGSVIKEAFSRFWPIIGSSILFGLISLGIIIVPIVIIAFTGVVVAAAVHPVGGILLGIVLFLVFAILVGLLLTRWSFYFGSVVLDKVSPGLGRSWRLTRKRTWVLLGLYIVFYLIISCISFGVQMTFGMVLGNSVLLTLITNLITLVTTMIFSVGYGVMYLDAKTRHDADDLKEMLEEFKTV